MTEQRKTLLAIAAMLLVVNAVALAVMNTKPAPTPNIWFGAPLSYTTPPHEDGSDIQDVRPIAILSRYGATLNGHRVPFTAIIDNVGRTAFLRDLETCIDTCLSTPWFANAVAARDTPISVVLAAARDIRARCNTEFAVFGNFQTIAVQMSNLEGPIVGNTLIFNDNSREIGVMADYPFVFDPTLMHLDRHANETLDQFGERTGCARFSPLRP